MWFAALGSDGEWFSNLLRRISEGSSGVLALLDTSAVKAKLNGRLPAALRISEYRYYFATGTDGAWWRRELVGRSRPITGVELGAFRDMPLAQAAPSRLSSFPIVLARRCVALIGPVGFVWLALAIPCLVKGCAFLCRKRRLDHRRSATATGASRR